MPILASSDKPVIQAELRRSKKGRSVAQYEVQHEGQVLDRRSSEAHDFTQALLAQSADGSWSRLSYHSKADALAKSLRSAQRRLKWPVQFLVAILQTVAE